MRQVQRGLSQPNEKQTKITNQVFLRGEPAWVTWGRSSDLGHAPCLTNAPPAGRALRQEDKTGKPKSKRKET